MCLCHNIFGIPTLEFHRLEIQTSKQIYYISSLIMYYGMKTGVRIMYNGKISLMN